MARAPIGEVFDRVPAGILELTIRGKGTGRPQRAPSPNRSAGPAIAGPSLTRSDYHRSGRSSLVGAAGP